jgi:DNA primase
MKSIFERVRVVDALRAANKPEPNAHGFFLCPAHNDSRPSAHVIPASDGRAWICFACGARGGIADLAVALGLGQDRRSVARALEERIR